MIFTVINSEKGSLESRGYILSESSKRVTDYAVLEKIEAQKGEAYTKELANRFSTEEEPICRGDDGCFYSVLFEEIEDDNHNKVSEAVMWQAVTVKKIMNFTIINSEKKPLEDRGYKFAENSKRVINYTALEKLTVDKGEEYAESLTDRFLKEMEPICMGEDGVFYYVLFHDLSDNSRDFVSQGIMWQEVSVLNIIKHNDDSDKSQQTYE